MNLKCVYLTEGQCEEKLINTLKESPQKLIPGKVKVFNTVLKLIPKSQLITFTPGSTVVFVFDTDVKETGCLKENLLRVKNIAARLRLLQLHRYLILRTNWYDAQMSGRFRISLKAKV